MKYQLLLGVVCWLALSTQVEGTFFSMTNPSSSSYNSYGNYESKPTLGRIIGAKIDGFQNLKSMLLSPILTIATSLLTKGSGLSSGAGGSTGSYGGGGGTTGSGYAPGGGTTGSGYAPGGKTTYSSGGSSDSYGGGGSTYSTSYGSTYNTGPSSSGNTYGGSASYGSGGSYGSYSNNAEYGYVGKNDNQYYGDTGKSDEFYDSSSSTINDKYGKYPEISSNSATKRDALDVIYAIPSDNYGSVSSYGISPNSGSRANYGRGSNYNIKSYSTPTKGIGFGFGVHKNFEITWPSFSHNSGY